MYVPAGETGIKNVQSEVEYQTVGMVNPITRTADPNPLAISDIGPVLIELAIQHAVSWPVAGSDGFILEMADDPAGPWLAANAVPATNGTYKVVLLEPLAARKFYRLHKP